MQRGDRIAQLIVERYASVRLEEVAFGRYAPDPLAPTLRGAQSFGSTGLNTPDSTPVNTPVDPRSLDGTSINSEVLRAE